MDQNFLRALWLYVTCMNTCETSAATVAIEETGHRPEPLPYLDRCPIVFEGELRGFLVRGADTYFFLEASDAELAWWANRPWLDEAAMNKVMGL